VGDGHGELLGLMVPIKRDRFGSRENHISNMFLLSIGNALA
jgi:hypothetical protein